MGSLLRLAACLALCFAIGAAAAYLTRPEIATWYAGLVKPSWTPPTWVFPVAWNILYAMMAISLWRLWERAREGREGAQSAVALFLAQLALNAAWSPVFFGLHALQAGFVVIVALAIVLAATIVAARRVDTIAGWLLVPYMVWILYATSLNGAIALLN